MNHIDNIPHHPYHQQKASSTLQDLKDTLLARLEANLQSGRAFQMSRPLLKKIAQGSFPVPFRRPSQSAKPICEPASSPKQPRNSTMFSGLTEDDRKQIKLKLSSGDKKTKSIVHLLTSLEEKCESEGILKAEQLKSF